MLTGLWDLKDILNSRQNRPKNKLVRENAVARVHGICSLRLWAPDGSADKNTFGIYCFIVRFQNVIINRIHSIQAWWGGGGGYNQMYFICKKVDGAINARGLWADVKYKLKSVIHWNH